MGVFNPDRLDLARRRRGLTKTKLAEALDVSLRMIVGYERAEYAPSPKTIVRMSEVLRFPEHFFSGPSLDEPPLEGSSFRALTTLVARQRDQALAAGALALSLADWIGQRFTLPPPAIPAYQGLDPETAAIAVRSEWGLGQLPIRNMVHLLEAKGARMFSLSEESRELDAFSFWRREVPYVFLNLQKSAERLRMDAAHELGHLVLHWKGGVRGRKAESEAQQFGSAFLMPRESVLAGAPRGGRLADIMQAKQRWNVAATALTYRMRVCGLLSEWQYRALFVEMSKAGDRTNERNGSVYETSQVLGKVFRALRQEGVTLAAIAEELGMFPNELRSMIFGLVLTPLEGTGSPARPPALSAADDPQPTQPTLRLL